VAVLLEKEREREKEKEREKGRKHVNSHICKYVNILEEELQ
jgi:hypothetical protein